MFEKATRMKLRFNYKGLCSVEDLWDLPVEELDSIFKGLSARKRENDTDSLLGKETKEDKAIDLGIDIIKYIVKSKLAEKDRRLELAEDKLRKDKLREILASKRDDKLKEMSEEDIMRELDDEAMNPNQ